MSEKTNGVAANGEVNGKASSGPKAGQWVDDNCSFDTKLVHAGINPDPATGAILTPIIQSTTFVQESVDKYLAKGYSYSRTRNPTVETLAEKVAILEGGHGATMFGTGMAATVTVMSAFLKTGDHVIITDCSYGGTNRAARIQFAQHYNIEVSFVDFRDVALIEAAVKPNTKMLFSETPANPTLTLTDIAAVSALAKRIGAIHVCDSTFSTPVIMRPLDYGADCAVISTTKYYCGHNISTGGAVACKTKEHDDAIKFYQNVHGNIMSPQVAYYQLQTAKTMGLRVRRQCETAQAIADFLESHPAVEKVNYPGLDSFPQRALAVKQHAPGLHGGMLWFEVVGGVENGRKLMDSIQRPWSLCENLGAVESIITCPAVMTHANMLKEDRLKVGITDGFVRVSCGIEDCDDLIRSLKVSLDALLSDGGEAGESPAKKAKTTA